jgi:hypothetical protein
MCSPSVILNFMSYVLSNVHYVVPTILTCPPCYLQNTPFIIPCPSSYSFSLHSLWAKWNGCKNFTRQKNDISSKFGNHPTCKFVISIQYLTTLVYVKFFKPNLFQSNLVVVWIVLHNSIELAKTHSICVCVCVHVMVYNYT